MINKKRLIESFVKLVEIKGESKRESAIANYLKCKLERLGLNVTQDFAHEEFNGECGNLWIKIPGKLQGKALLLSAHMDTVKTGGAVVPVVKNGIIRSKGNTILGADNRAGIAAILEIVAILNEKELSHRTIVIVFTVAEEIGLLGAQHAKLNSNEYDYGVVLDGSGPIGTIINEAPFHVQWKIKVKGRSAHAGLEPEQGLNAIKIAARVLNKIPSGRISESCTTNIGKIIGGTTINIVPDLVTIHGEVRSTDSKELHDTLNLIKNTCIIESHSNSMGVSFESKVTTDGYFLSKSTRVIQELSYAANANGFNPIIKGSCGGSDANAYNKHGIKTGVISCGMRNAHTQDEAIHITDLIGVSKMLLTLVTNK